MQDCWSNLSAVVKIAEPFQQNSSKPRVITGFNQIIQDLLSTAFSLNGKSQDVQFCKFPILPGACLFCRYVQYLYHPQEVQAKWG